MILPAALLISTLLAADSHHWIPVRANHPLAVASGITVSVPGDWVYDEIRRGLVASRDGPLLELATFVLVPHAEAFALAHRESRPDMSPEDLADAYLANLQAGDAPPAEMHDVQTTPEVVAAQEGFRVRFRYRSVTPSGSTEVEHVTVGVALRTGLLLATFEAPALHYAPTYLAAFNAMVESLKPSR